MAGAGLTGGVDASVLQRLLGTEVNGRLPAYCSDHLHVDLLAGFRFLALDEGLDLATNSTDENGVNTLSAESFSTRNRFYGGHVGATARWESYSHLSVEMTGKIALGGTDQIVNINGVTIVNDPNSGQSSAARSACWPRRPTADGMSAACSPWSRNSI